MKFQLDGVIRRYAWMWKGNTSGNQGSDVKLYGGVIFVIISGFECGGFLQKRRV